MPFIKETIPLTTIIRRHLSKIYVGEEMWGMVPSEPKFSLTTIIPAKKTSIFVIQNDALKQKTGFRI